jgi:hypothetical protein
MTDRTALRVEALARWRGRGEIVARWPGQVGVDPRLRLPAFGRPGIAEPGIERAAEIKHHQHPKHDQDHAPARRQEPSHTLLLLWGESPSRARGSQSVIAGPDQGRKRATHSMAKKGSLPLELRVRVMWGGAIPGREKAAMATGGDRKAVW